MVLASASPAAGNCPGPGYAPGLGPLSFRSQGPGQVLRLTPIPRAPEVLAAGQREFRANAALSSVYARDARFYIDMHLADTRAAVATGLGNCWDLELAVDQRAIVNAYLDDITLTFHRLFQFENSGHDDAPRNTTDVRFPEYGVHLDEGDRGAFSRSVEVTLNHLLRPRTPHWPATAVSLIVRHETLEKDGGTDLGAGVSLGQKVGDNRVYADLTYIWFGSNRYLGIPLEKQQFAGMLAYEWRRGEGFSWLAQYLYTDGVMKNVGALDEPAHEVHLGAKWGIGRFTAEAALIENIITYNNSPDFGFAFGLKAPF
jgi:hypothetical protein